MTSNIEFHKLEGIRRTSFDPNVLIWMKGYCGGITPMQLTLQEAIKLKESLDSVIREIKFFNHLD